MLTSWDKYREYYRHRLPDFLSEIDSFGDIGYPYGVFLSHPLPEYDNAKKKVFYIGRDTNGWIDFSEMMELYHKDRIMDYIDNQWPTSPEEMAGWGNKMTFWTVVFKLHIYLSHGIILPRLEDYSEEQKRCLLELGFGNMNSVEVPSSMQNDGSWVDIDEEKYWAFKNSSRRFDRLKDILDLYHPVIVYIFSWTDDNIFIQGLELVEDLSLREDHWRAVYTIKGYGTQLVWTSHPTYFSRRITRDVNKVVKYLGDTVLGKSSG